MDATPALWIVFLVALLIATFDNGEFSEWLKVSAIKRSISTLGSLLMLLSQILADASVRLAQSAYCRFGNTTGRQAERMEGE